VEEKLSGRSLGSRRFLRTAKVEQLALILTLVTQSASCAGTEAEELGIELDAVCGQSIFDQPVLRRGRRRRHPIAVMGCGILLMAALAFAF
jgi:hypothetical protein